MKRKVCVIITARASYSRIKSALFEIDKHPNLELFLVVTGSALLAKYGNVDRVIENDGLPIHTKLQFVVEGENLVTSAKGTGIALMELSTVFANLNPDLVVTIADRHETIATAIAASYMNIPVVHIQGGEVSGSIDDRVRHAITKLSDWHFVSNEKAAERVVRMGEKPETVFVTGCPSIDIAHSIFGEKTLNFDPFKKYRGVGPILDISNGYLIVMQHPVTTEFKENKIHIQETLYAVARTKMPALWFWPNVDAGSDDISKRIRFFREFENSDHICFFKNMSPEDFLRLLFRSKCIIGNSSVAVREGSFLGVPAVNIGSRQNMRQRGINVMEVDYRKDDIYDTIMHQVKNGRYQPENIYGDGKAGEKIARYSSEIPLITKGNNSY